MTITISLSSAAKLSALVKDQGGDWDNGFTCKTVYINNVDQGGEVKIFPKEIDQPSGEQVYGMTFIFTNPPKNEFKKVGRDLGNNKWRIAYRRMLNNFNYVNPFGNKYIEGTVQDEAGNQYPFKLLLPYKVFGWYINDEQGNKIANRMNNHATDRTAAVVSAKYILKNTYPNYETAKKDFEKMTKSQAEYEAGVKANEAKLTSLQTNVESLKTKATEAEKNLNAKKIELLQAQETLDSLTKKESSISSEKNAITESFEASTSTQTDLAKKKADLATKLEAEKQTLDSEFAKLLKNAPQRTADINNSQTELYAGNKDGFKTNLNKVYP